MMSGFIVQVWGKPWKTWMLCVPWCFPVPDGDIDHPFVHSPLLSVCLFSWSCVLVEMASWGKIATGGDISSVSAVSWWLLQSPFSIRSFHVGCSRMAAFLPVLNGKSSSLWYLLCIQNLPAFTDLLSHFFPPSCHVFPTCRQTLQLYPSVALFVWSMRYYFVCMVNEILYFICN